jgi:hypothetical protein
VAEKTNLEVFQEIVNEFNSFIFGNKESKIKPKQTTPEIPKIKKIKKRGR